MKRWLNGGGITHLMQHTGINGKTERKKERKKERRGHCGDTQAATSLLSTHSVDKSDQHREAH